MLPSIVAENRLISREAASQPISSALLAMSFTPLATSAGGSLRLPCHSVIANPMASDTGPTALTLDHSSLPHAPESYKLGLPDFDPTPRDASANEINLNQSTLSERTHALHSTVRSTARSPATSEVDTSESAVARAESHIKPALIAQPHDATAIDLSGTITSSDPKDPVIIALSDQMVQDQIGVGGSMQHLNPHKFTLTVPFDKAYAIRVILEKIRDEFELGDNGLDWKYNKKQCEGRQRKHEKQIAPNKGTSSAIEETPNSTSKQLSFKNRWGARIAKIQPLSLSYADVRIDEIIDHAVRTWWRGLANNLYHLPPAFYFLVFLGLTAWAFGSIVCGYFEAMARLKANDRPGAWPAFWRGTLGAIPALTGIITFLFPPTFCVRYR